ncbi:site-specific integrase [Streptomyces antibioticus]|uniref:site-specific integrase n=1 Tax=Streptomyces antibioticus TaxID=1890 RepID=UPI0004C70338
MAEAVQRGARASALRAPRRVAESATDTDTRSHTAASVRALTSPEDVRAALISELDLHLSTTTNKHGRPFQRRTINAYVNAGKALSSWIGASQHVNAAGVEVTAFTDVDVSTANAFFRWWYQTNDVPKSQGGKGGYTGGVNTTQRNLRALFVYLSEEFIQDTLDITAWGPGRKDFETTRDHVLLRVLTEGLRAEEILNIRLQDLDLQGAVLVVVPLKMDRNSVDGRVIPPAQVRSRHGEPARGQHHAQPGRPLLLTVARRPASE